LFIGGLDRLAFDWTWTYPVLDGFGRIFYHHYFKLRPMLDWTWSSEGIAKNSRAYLGAKEVTYIFIGNSSKS